MDDTRRELAERREPLGANDLLLEDVDLRLVLTDRDDGLDRPAGRARPARSHHTLRTGGPSSTRRQHHRDRGVVLAAQRLGEQRRELLALFGRDEVADVAAEDVVARRRR